MKKSSSSVPPGLKLKTEQADGGDRQGSGVVNCLELRLGISSDNGNSPWRVVDPWSLAARQQKASLEKQAHQRPDECDLERENGPAAPSHQPVGWPPVRAFRKNLSSAAKPDDAFLLSNKVRPCSEDDDHGGERSPAPPMFVKVNLEGCAVGRKVDLQAHRGYGSLSRALQSMFHGFLLSDAQWRIASSSGNTNKLYEDDKEHEQQQVETKKKTYILLYEDNEGDRMLVGDVPWELFVASVKRLYIAQDTRTRATPVS
ncbi:hypothetical protein PR202_ga30949 [Eleusine coracana subsp. coracana]|uniref:Auxin-responsive protein n=1 Tax=Eleusine coracana subsp. coracana TaxID=191504 RepID=A0AAV5DPR1_ELECO|nr:hypothetical protein QOZ80_8AG0614720 [Eleusine coracana subsp. coracana]GJN12654.1 hypothetical protein PR202_ga30949 [Eleusine coracana subsp. coracana]